MKSKVKKTERGWAGHFCASHECMYHRNTLLEYGDRKVVVSTIGRWLDKDGRNFIEVGSNRYFETMAFMAKVNDKYNDADVRRKVHFSSEWALPSPDMELEADAMHERVVNEISMDLEHGTLSIVKY